ncbi:DUF7716 domain-containing protein [Shewanella mangrovisoli]|uniref:DUF7716 domain-containing protein n=1 Tax=Shewanella mangrovisoli TaxID=2864211 RepID=UPI001C65A2B3|nr:hypothetical protein [Shewanella mangrovisoli]QYK10858.1 hypothetical protein K0H60_09400 [Shewanella mangrovisoli]
MRLTLTLETLLSQLGSLSWHLDVYKTLEQPLNPTMTMLIIDDELEEERDQQDEPLYPQIQGYQYFLSIADLQSIKANLVQQLPNATLHDIIHAVSYYYQNDAYMNLES